MAGRSTGMPSVVMGVAEARTKVKETMQSRADVVIIGAGVIGCSTAYHLAKLGVSDVAVVEMDEVGSGTSSKSASMLSLQFHDELTIRMAQYSYQRYMHFEEEFDTSIDFKKIGWLSVATEETADELREGAELLHSLGVRTDLLSPDDVKAIYPEANVEDVALGTLGPDDGPFDPHMIMWGYLNKARRNGAKLYQDARATGLEVRNGRVEGVVTNRGTIATGTVVNAAGPWAMEVGKWVGVKVPIINLARSIIVTGPFPQIPPDRPLIEDVAAAWYVRHEVESMLMGMGMVPVEDPDDVQFTSEFMDEMIDVAVHRVPVLERASLLTWWTGVRPMTPDDQPILGPVPGVDGFILNAGWNGAGIILSPIAGQLAAEIIVEGQASTMDATPLSIERFAGDPV